MEDLELLHRIRNALKTEAARKLWESLAIEGGKWSIVTVAQSEGLDEAVDEVEMMAKEAILLGDYCKQRDNVVIFFHASHGTTGYLLSSHLSKVWLSLCGAINVDGRWFWNGTGDLTDGRGAAMTGAVAYSDSEKFVELVAPNN